MKSGKRTYIQHIDCIHRKHLANQGMTFCFEGDITHCDTCPKREPRDMEVTESWASTSDSDDILWMDGSAPNDV